MCEIGSGNFLKYVREVGSLNFLKYMGEIGSEFLKYVGEIGSGLFFEVCGRDMFSEFCKYV